jgi:hypothetical protein
MANKAFFHYTSCQLLIGNILSPQTNGYCQLPENAVMEAILEDFRPEKCISRNSAIFLTDKPIEDGEKIGASGADYELQVTACPDTFNQKSDLNWLNEIDQGHEFLSEILENFSIDEIQTIADGYWSGRAYNCTPSFEFRALGAIVTDIRET